MTLKTYFFLMTMGTLICWTAWVFVLFNISPTSAGLIGLIFFYLSLFLATVGTFSVIGYVVRKAIYKNEDVAFRHVSRSFEHSVAISVILIILLILLSEQLLYWWNSLALVVFFVIIEAKILAGRRT